MPTTEDLPPEPSAWRFCVAPMMDWTDRFCRRFHRALAPSARLYTEMVTTGALLHGDVSRHLRFDPAEHPVALQLGGSDPDALARCAVLGEQWGYDEINLNCGCPSDRVQSGLFGAILMRDAALVAECVRGMRAACGVPVTVKHRIGVDDLGGFDFVSQFIETVAAAGCKTFIVHARKAWLSGLSPKENREIPPLDYPLVYRLKERFPELTIVINGGIQDIESCQRHLARVDGVMLGREAYENPYVLSEIDAALICQAPEDMPSRAQVLEAYCAFVAEELSNGTPLNRITRHIMGLYRGQPGGRQFRRLLSEKAGKPGADLRTLELALEAVEDDPIVIAA